LTHITHVNEGFDLLGQNLRKYGGKLSVRPSKKNTHAFLGESPNDLAREQNPESGVIADDGEVTLNLMVVMVPPLVGDQKSGFLFVFLRREDRGGLYLQLVARLRHRHVSHGQ
jgi:hypothetical protein